MTDEELQVIKEDYETSIIKLKQAENLIRETRKKLEADEFALKTAKNVHAKAYDSLLENRKKYEKAFCEFYDEYNE